MNPETSERISGTAHYLRDEIVWLETHRAIRGTFCCLELLDWNDTAETVEAGKWADLVAVTGHPSRLRNCRR